MWRYLALLALLVLSLPILADDWPQWMGPNRDGVWAEKGILDKFPEKGLTKVWSAPIQAGYSGPAVARGRVYVLDRKLAAKQKLPDNPFDDRTNVVGSERVLCLDSTTGKEVWKHEYPCDYRVSFGLGPRCTPTVDGERVYCLGTMGDLKCLKSDNGDVVWSLNCCTDLRAKCQHWGFCGHPLVYKNLLIALVGGQDGLIMAFEKESGKRVWSALKYEEHGAGYSPPTLIHHDGQPILLQFHASGLSALEPLTGRQLWTIPMKPAYGMSIMAPQLRGHLLFVAGAGCGAVLELQPKGGKPVELWHSESRLHGLHPVNMTPLLDDECIYGVCQFGALRGIELRTGKRIWETYTPVLDAEHGQDFRGLNSATAFLVKHEDRYFSFNERGTLRIMKLNSSGPVMISDTKLLEPTSVGMGRKVLWSHPAFANKCVFVRNDQELACFSLEKK
jgi:outer membrane protein assembly factor BamB